MKGDMEVEILTEPAPKSYKERMDKIVMTEAERELYAYCPNAARGNKRPGYMVDDDSGYGDTQ